MKCRIGRLQYVRPPDSAYMRGRKYIRNRGYGGSVRTSAQAAVKSIFKQLSQSWKYLTNAQILAWNALANPPALQDVEAPTEAVVPSSPSNSRANQKM